MEIKRHSTTDPPAGCPPFENLNEVTEFECIPRSQFVARHLRPSVGRRVSTSPGTVRRFGARDSRVARETGDEVCRHIRRRLGDRIFI